MPTDVLLDCADVSKTYGKTTVLSDMALTLNSGEVFGFLGPNGAGKTTFIKILLGLVTPTTGRVSLFGEDLFVNRRSIMKRIGAVVEAPIFFDYMTAWDNLRYLCNLSEKVGDDRIKEVLGTVGLADVAEKKVGTFSYGMKQRLGIAQALLPDSRFLILDEPTNGLDPHGIAGMRRLIHNLSESRDITIFVASHLLVEVEQVCDRVAIIHHGRKVLEGPVGDLRQDHRDVLVVARGDADVAALPFNLTDDEVHGELRRLTFRLTDEQPVPELVRTLVGSSLDIEEVQPLTQTLEDIFIEHTKDARGDVRIDSF
jgi:bacitracin transport system ATP-binding protein